MAKRTFEGEIELIHEAPSNSQQSGPGFRPFVPNQHDPNVLPIVVAIAVVAAAIVSVVVYLSTVS